MTEVVLYHHIQGLTGGVQSFGEKLRQAGHTVHTPDLFDGRTFATIEEGMAFAREAGFGALADRGVAAARHTPEREPSTVWRDRGHAFPRVDHPIVRELMGIAAVRVHHPQLATGVVGADLYGALEEDPAPIRIVGGISEIVVISGRRRGLDGMDVRP